MANNGVHTRAGRAAAVSAALIALVAGCSGGQNQSTGTPTPGNVPSSSSGTPGRLTAQASGVTLTINDALAHVSSSGTGELTMSVRNDGDVPEHLAMVATSEGGRAGLQGAASGPNGSLSTAGILLMPHTTVTFGGSGPRVFLPALQLASTDRTVPLTVQFGVVGLVHLQAIRATS